MKKFLSFLKGHQLFAVGAAIGIALVIIGSTNPFQSCMDICGYLQFNPFLIADGVVIVILSTLHLIVKTTKHKRVYWRLASGCFFPFMILSIGASINGWLVFVLFPVAGILALVLMILGIVESTRQRPDKESGPAKK